MSTSKKFDGASSQKEMTKKERQAEELRAKKKAAREKKILDYHKREAEHQQHKSDRASAAERARLEKEHAKDCEDIVRQQELDLEDKMARDARDQELAALKIEYFPKAIELLKTIHPHRTTQRLNININDWKITNSLTEGEISVLRTLLMGMMRLQRQELDRVDPTVIEVMLNQMTVGDLHETYDLPQALPCSVLITIDVGGENYYFDATQHHNGIIIMDYGLFYPEINHRYFYAHFGNGTPGPSQADIDAWEEMMANTDGR